MYKSSHAMSWFKALCQGFGLDSILNKIQQITLHRSNVIHCLPPPPPPHVCASLRTCVFLCSVAEACHLHASALPVSGKSSNTKKDTRTGQDKYRDMIIV